MIAVSRRCTYVPHRTHTHVRGSIIRDDSHCCIVLVFWPFDRICRSSDGVVSEFVRSDRSSLHSTTIRTTLSRPSLPHHCVGDLPLVVQNDCFR